MEERRVLFPPVLPSLVRFAKAFPPLVEDILTLLTRLGKVVLSESCVGGYSSPKDFGLIADGIDAVGRNKKNDPATAEGSVMVRRVKETVDTIMENVAKG